VGRGDRATVEVAPGGDGADAGGDNAGRSAAIAGGPRRLTAFA
jgi:hypothetical protein